MTRKKIDKVKSGNKSLISWIWEHHFVVASCILAWKLNCIVLQYFQFQVFCCNNSASRLKKVKSVAWQIDEAIADGQNGQKDLLAPCKSGQTSNGWGWRKKRKELLKPDPFFLFSTSFQMMDFFAFFPVLYHFGCYHHIAWTSTSTLTPIPIKNLVKTTEHPFLVLSILRSKHWWCFTYIYTYMYSFGS